MTLPASATCFARFVLLILGVLLWGAPAVAGPITGNYWYYGVGNDAPPDDSGEGKALFDVLRDFLPWKNIPKERYRIRKNIGGKQIGDDLKHFHDSVKSGDTFIFYYGGHTSRKDDDNRDDADGKDEVIGDFGKKPDVISDDELASDPIFGSFPECATVIVIMNCCFAGGFIDGTSDLSREAIRNKKNLLFMGSTPAGELCGPRERATFLTDLVTALEEGQKDDKQTHAKEWGTIMERLWRARGFGLSKADYLDEKHDRTVANEDSDDDHVPVPAPGSALLLTLGLIGLGAARAARSSAC